jgi:tRNA dimethylallyltransferase
VSRPEKLKIIFVLGPTASGKTSLALKLAQSFGGSIWNCDSVQAYCGLDIGSAKPSSQERALCPHFLFDLISPPQELTAGEYRRLFFEQLSYLQKYNPELLLRPVFVVGGTGFYFQALEKGLFEVPASQIETRRPFEQILETANGQEKLFEILKQKDPNSASWIKPQDHYRLVRALELLSLGFVPSLEKSKKQERAQDFPGDLLKLGLSLEKESHRKIVSQRTQEMMNQGLVAEVEDLFQKGYAQWAPLQSVGYKEVSEYLASGKTESDLQLQERIVQGTMKLIKKQKTWFYRDSEINWINPLEPSHFEVALTLVQNFLDKRLTD